MVSVNCAEAEPEIDVLDVSKYTSACEVAPAALLWARDGEWQVYARKGRDSARRALLLGVDSSLAVRRVMATGAVTRGTHAWSKSVVARFGADGRISSVTEMFADGDTVRMDYRERSRPASREIAARMEQLGRELARQCLR